MRMNEMVEKVREEIAGCEHVGTSWVQRKLGLSYGQAEDSLRALQLRGIVGPRDPEKGYQRKVHVANASGQPRLAQGDNHEQDQKATAGQP
jgi:ribosomal protein S25